MELQPYKKLFYFTQSYPFGIGEQWKANELKELTKYFGKISVVPFNYGGNFDSPKPLPEGVRLVEPLFKDQSVPVSKTDLLKFLLHRKRLSFIGEFFKKRVFINKNRLVKWAVATKLAIRLLENEKIKDILRVSDHETVYYFYWGKGSCEMMPFINTMVLKRSFVRMHRFDLFEYVNNNYIPYRRQLLKACTTIAPSSVAGKEHLLSLYPSYGDKIHVFRCGTVGNGRTTRPSIDGKLRIVSCSMLVPVKRVQLMIASLKFIDFPCEWTHIGDGILKEQLSRTVKENGVGNAFSFLGMKDSREIMDFYTDNIFDVFVNVSESEGVPFSIMEAFSAGIPVIATQVGGTGEIVDNETGRLLNADVSAEELATALKEFHTLSPAKKELMRKECVARYETYWNAVSLANELGNYLTS